MPIRPFSFFRATLFLFFTYSIFHSQNTFAQASCFGIFDSQEHHPGEIFTALIQGSTDVVEARLGDPYFDVNIYEPMGKNVLQTAIWYKRADAVKLIASQRNLIKLEVTLEDLLYAYRYGSVQMLRDVLSTRPNANKKDDFGNTLLHYIAIDENFQVADMLANQPGLNLQFNSVNNRGETPLDIIHKKLEQIYSRAPIDRERVQHLKIMERAIRRYQISNYH